MENLILDNGSEAEYLADTCDYDFNDLVTNNKDMKKKVLKLTLKRKWYNLIAIGAKREEYREIKEYWLKRLFDVQSPMIAKFDFGDVGLTPKDFTHVQFRLGYKKNAPTMEFQITDIDINRGDNRMGAPYNKLIVLLSERGFTELDVRETQNQIDEFNARMYSMSKKLGVTDMVVPTHDNVGLPTPKVIGDKWEYWCLLPERP